jgi:hypothetical protein
VEALDILPILVNIESLLEDVFDYFYISSKKHAEFFKLAKVMEIKDLKILYNIKTRWMSMMGPSIQVMNEYRTLFIKMLQDTQLKNTKPNVNMLQFAMIIFNNIQVVLGLVAIMPILHLLNVMI